MSKICGYSCEHNKSGVCQISGCDKKSIISDKTEVQTLRLDELDYTIIPNSDIKPLLDRLQQENKQLRDKLSKIETLIINHNCDTGDIYYKYNSKFLKSELKQRILEILEDKEALE
jgi:hypothetical protein